MSQSTQCLGSVVPLAMFLFGFWQIYFNDSLTKIQCCLLGCFCFVCEMDLIRFHRTIRSVWTNSLLLDSNQIKWCLFCWCFRRRVNRSTIGDFPTLVAFPPAILHLRFRRTRQTITSAMLVVMRQEQRNTSALRDVMRQDVVFSKYHN